MPGSKLRYKRLRTFWIIVCMIFPVSGIQSAAGRQGRAVPAEHPRLLGSREYLQSLAASRPDAYKRVVAVARQQKADDHAKMISMSLVCVIENDEPLGRDAMQLSMKYVTGPIKKGHIPFAHDLARCAIVYDLCHEFWTQEQRAQFHEYMNATVDANVRSETHVFHNGWYGYTDQVPQEQRLRDVISLETGDGSAEVMKMIVVREIMGREYLPY